MNPITNLVTIGWACLVCSLPFSALWASADIKKENLRKESMGTYSDKSAESSSNDVEKRGLQTWK
jgi:hypothetical protein